MQTEGVEPGPDQGQGDGLIVAHLSHQDHIGIFPESGSQSIGKRKTMLPNLTLMNQTIFIGMDKLQGIFQGNDMIIHMFVNEINHGGQSG